ncbi:MAG: hypothetical protein EOP04_01285 [Proteobacteria bacterium]|nr:MAG: hypothetical protein EOP04_01285 [Pseudomonadota bacterium]
MTFSLSKLKLLWLLIATQAILIPFLFGVDVPYRDEWDSIIRALIMREADGFQWKQLFLPVVEHRLPLPMAAFNVLSLPRYYPKLLMLITAGVHCIGWYYFMRSWSRLGSFKPWALILSFAFYFHYAQITNYTMGVQLFWMLGPVGTIVFITGLIESRLTMITLGHLIGTFSFPVWPIHFALFLAWLVLQAREKRFPSSRLISLSSALLMTTGIISLGFLYQSAGPGLNTQVLRLLQFAVYVIASPISRYKETLAMVVGPCFILLWIYGAWSKPRFVSQTAYFLYGILGFVSALLIAYGRHLYDLSYAFGGHYLLLTAPAWCLTSYELISRIAKPRFAFTLASTLTLYVFVIGIRGAAKELRGKIPMQTIARECLIHAKELDPHCKDAMEFIFLNGFNEKYELVRKARILGIYP